MLKYLKCPYKLVLIKYIQKKRHDCNASKSKKPPFSEAEIKEDKNAANTKFK